jgi:hypothetical protein
MTDCQSQAAVNSIPLHSSVFQESLLRYVDETKPDALTKRQIESWTLEWEEHSSKNAPIHGRLTIKGDYMVLTMHVRCNWSYTQGIGSLDFLLEATARFLTQSELKTSTIQTFVGKKGELQLSKIRATMRARLKEDDYIKKLLLGENTAVLCEATITVDEPEHKLEEKVYINDDGLEAFRRCIYSRGDDSLAVMELLASLDFLKTPGCPLGKRAKLRLLEEAMADACEKQVEEEFLVELAIFDRVLGVGDIDELRGSMNSEKKRAK